MKLYTYDGAPNGQRLNLFLQYKGITIDTTQVDLGSAEQLGDDYKAINPYCTIPALVLDDGTLLTEVIGIVTYLETLHPDRPLLGSGALEKAQVISWVHRIIMMMTSALATHARSMTSSVERGPFTNMTRSGIGFSSTAFETRTIGRLDHSSSATISSMVCSVSPAL